jgi:hypothetical protein
MGRISNWFPPFAGVIFVVFFAAVVILIGGGEDATKKTAQEVADHYKDNDTEEGIAAFCMGFAALFSLYFGGWLRRVLRDAEGPDGILSAVAFAGVIVFAAGATIAGSVHLALTDLADDINPIALQAINGIDYDLFMFLPVGLGTMTVAAGISALRHGAFPKWLAWLGIVVGVLFFSPAFPVGLVGVPVWVLIVSVMGISRTRSAAPAAA